MQHRKGHQPQATDHRQDTKPESGVLTQAFGLEMGVEMGLLRSHIGKVSPDHCTRA